MVQRHRIPTIFNIYMVDVLCCALGCVILLWLINFREAKTRAAVVEKTKEDLKSSSSEVFSLSKALDLSRDQEKLLAQKLAALLKDHDVTRAKLTQTEKDLIVALKDRSITSARLTQTEKDLAAVLKDYELLDAKTLQALKDLAETLKERDLLKTQLASSQKDQSLSKKETALNLTMLAQLRTETKDLLAQKLALETTLADKTRAHETAAKVNAELAKKIALAEQKVLALEKDLSTRTAQHTAATKTIDDLAGRLKLADVRAATLEKDLTASRTEAKELQGKLLAAMVRVTLAEDTSSQAKKELVANAARLQDLLKDHDALTKRFLLSTKSLDDARILISLLEKDRVGLLNQAKSLLKEAENRFAGINLTGQRVVFMIDMSGSMAMKDQYTPAPEKWPQVCEIVGKIMKSLPGLKKYQIILFSDKVRYPLSSQGEWLDYHGELSAKAAVDALKAIEPKGETSMSPAFAEAFRFRPLGLDTIYFLSDGLPNAGDGIPPNAGMLGEAQKIDYLTRYIRLKLQKDWNRYIPGQGNRVKINAIGFFFESPDLGAFLWALARENDGNFVGMSQP